MMGTGWHAAVPIKACTSSSLIGEPPPGLVRTCRSSSAESEPSPSVSNRLNAATMLGATGATAAFVLMVAERSFSAAPRTCKIS